MLSKREMQMCPMPLRNYSKYSMVGFAERKQNRLMQINGWIINLKKEVERNFSLVSNNNENNDW